MSQEIVTVQPVVDTAAYAAGDCIGGKLTLAGAMRVRGGKGKLQSVTVLDLAQQKDNLRIFLFSGDPAAGTYTDQAALDIHDTDAAKLLGLIKMEAADFVDAADNSFACLSGIELPVKAAAGSRDLYALVMAGGGPDYVAATDLTLKFGFERD